ncbi:MAG: putative bifunctional diguanylate cyclase/phosphodiesterase [Gammaproteobacteria bacterium]
MFGVRRIRRSGDKIHLGVLISLASIWLLFGMLFQFVLFERITASQNNLILWGAIVLSGLACLCLVGLFSRHLDRQHRRLGVAVDALYDVAHPQRSKDVPSSTNEVYETLVATKQAVHGKINSAEVLAKFNHEVAQQSSWHKILDALIAALTQLADGHEKSIVFRFGEQDLSYYRIDPGVREPVKQRLKLSESEEEKLHRCNNGEEINLKDISPTLIQCQPNFASASCAVFRLSGTDGGYGFVFLSQKASDIEKGLLKEQVNSLAQLTGAALSRCERESNLYRLANFDSLTGLPNRTLLEDRTNQALRLAKRYQHRIGLMFIDLDGFKRINDSLGHSAGDKLLQGVADRLSTCIRESDTVARLGGDEFVVLVSEITDSEQSNLVLGGIAKTIKNAISRPFELNGKFVRVTPSVGVAISSKKADSYDTLLQAADTAMYTAKSNGEGTIRFFKREMSTTIVERMTLETELALAIDKQQLSLEYQPQVELSSGDIVGVESLLRWNHPTRGRISPARFIPLAEDSGIMGIIGNWALRQACADAASWHANGTKLPVSVNISAPQLKQSDLTLIIAKTLKEFELDPKLVWLEVSESSAMHDTQYTTNVLSELETLGVRLAIDDFGTSYSSLAYLSAMPVNRLKIDKRFIDDLSLNNSAKTVIDAIVGLGHGLGLEIVGEGVEQDVQQRLLTDARCDIAQGFYFAEPMAGDELLEFVAGWKLRSQNNVLPFAPKSNPANTLI